MRRNDPTPSTRFAMPLGLRGALAVTVTLVTSSLGPAVASAQVLGPSFGGMAVSDASSAAGTQTRLWTTTVVGELASYREDTDEWTEHVASDVTGSVAAVRVGSSPWTEHAFYVRAGRVRRIRLEGGTQAAEQTLLQPLDGDGDPISLSFTGSDVAAVDYADGPIAVAATSTDGRLCVWRVQRTTASSRPSCTARNVADPEADIAASAARLGASGHAAFFYRGSGGTLRRVAETVTTGGARRFTHVDMGAPTDAEIGRSIFTVREGGGDNFMVGLVSGNRLYFAYLDAGDTRASFNRGPALPAGVTISSYAARAAASRVELYDPVLERMSCRLVVYALTNRGLYALVASDASGSELACAPLRAELGSWTPEGHPDDLTFSSIGVADQAYTPFGPTARVFGTASVSGSFWFTVLAEHSVAYGWETH